LDNFCSKIASYFHCLFVGLIAGFFLLSLPGQSWGQERSYEILPAPDLWYNSVDGLRVGIRVLGQTPGSFGDGPHRLNAGLWVGTKFPDYPVSYHLKFTEPVNSLSEFGSEANINLQSAFRTGFQHHGLSFNKRWQNGFDERNYTELSVGYRAEDRFDNTYLLYQQLWQEQWLHIIHASVDLTNTNRAGRYILNIYSDANIAGPADSFLRGTLQFQQEVILSSALTLHGRLFSGFATDKTTPEYLFARSFDSPRSWMERGLTRARGTIPPNWIESGNIQVTGGAGLRGYTYQDTQSLNQGGVPLFTSLSAINLEMDYPNPIGKALNKIPVLGGFVNLRSYLFYDGGSSLGLTAVEETDFLSDAGLGFEFSINIPDYLGKPRGLAIRYDLPLWLSHPGTENPIKFRNVVGLGAVFSL